MIRPTPVTWPRRRYLTMCRRHPECEGDAVMAARCLGYTDAVVTGTPAPEWAPTPTFAEGIVDLTRRNWEDYSRVFGVQIHGAGEAMEIPEPAPMPAEMVPKELQGVRALGQYTQRPISTAEYIQIGARFRGPALMSEMARLMLSRLPSE